LNLPTALLPIARIDMPVLKRLRPGATMDDSLADREGTHEHHTR
jgi:hypothetical protein